MFPTANSNLPFLALLVGSIISYIGYCLWNRYVHLLPPLHLFPFSSHPYCLFFILAALRDWADFRFYFEQKFKDAGGKIKPEARLPMSLVGAFLFPVCLFWFAWTSNRTHWISPVIASSFFGIGITWMYVSSSFIKQKQNWLDRFMPFLTYLPHAYPQYAASVLASNDFFRSMMGAGMPLAARPLFNNLGIDWGNTLLGCLTVVFIPIPFVLYRYGPWLRSKSPMALHDEDIEDEKKNPMV